MDKHFSPAPTLSEGESNTSGRRARWLERNHGPQLRAALEEDASCFLHQSVSSPCLSQAAKAEGAYIEDTQGRRYLEFHGNNVHHIGYGHPRLKAAIARQMDELPFSPRRFACEPATALARKLAAIAPGDLAKVLFTTGGSNAVEVALKIARVATGRHKTVSFWDSFHGAGFGAASVGGEQLFRSHVIGDVRGRGLLMGVELVSDRDHKTPANDLAEDVFYRCFDRGLSFKISMGNTLSLTPPLIVTREQMDFALSVIDDALREAASAQGLG